MANLRTGLWAPACTGVVTPLDIWVILSDFRDFPSALWLTLQGRPTSAGHQRSWAQALAGWGACGHVVSHCAQSDVWKEALGCTKVFKFSSFAVTWTRACMSVYVNNQGNREVHTQAQALCCSDKSYLISLPSAGCCSAISLKAILSTFSGREVPKSHRGYLSL